jgi:hypothetical protein
MKYVIRPAKIGLAVDSDMTFDDPALDRLKGIGVQAILTYAQVLIAAPNLLERYCAKGFGVGCISYARKNGWTPSAATGGQDAAVELECAKLLGVPEGWGMCDDVEGASSAATAADVIAHEGVRSKTVAEAGYYPISYVGWNAMLTSEEWQGLPNLHGYYKAGGITRDRFIKSVEPARGWMAIQGLPFNQKPCAGAVVDFDFLVQDQRGNSWPLCWAE